MRCARSIFFVAVVVVVLKQQYHGTQAHGAIPRGKYSLVAPVGTTVKLCHIVQLFLGKTSQATAQCWEQKSSF